LSALRLKHLADIRVSNVDKKTVDGETPVRLCNYTDVYYRDSVIPDDHFMVATAAADQIERFRLRSGDVIITKDSETPDDIGIPAFVAQSAPDFVCGYHLAILRPNPDVIDGRYLHWSMSSRWVRQQLAACATGVTRFGLRTDVIASTLINVPALDEQRRIAGMVDIASSELTTATRLHAKRMHALRSRLAATIVARVAPWASRWPPGSWAADLTVRNSYDSFSETRLKYTVRDLVGGVWGADPDGGPDDIACVRVADFDRSRGVISEVPTMRCIEPRQRQSRELRAGDLLLEKSGGGERQVVGGVALYTHNVPAVCSNFIARMRPASGHDPGYLAYLHRALYALGRTRLYAKQTTGIQNLDVEGYLGERIALPGQCEQVRIRCELDELTETILEMQQQIERQIDLLRERHQSLITAAVTGELDPSLHRGASVAPSWPR
jgi:type I restriction enzyme S subunit